MKLIQMSVPGYPETSLEGYILDCELGLGYELHIFQYGPHGYSLADETCADGSSQVLDEAFAQWHELSVKWLHKTFGQPTFVDKSTSRMMGCIKDLGFDLPGSGTGNA